jgi:hypothetical protein
MEIGLNIQSAYFSRQNKLHDLYFIVHRRSKLMLFDEFKFDKEQILTFKFNFIHIMEK